MNRIIWNEWKQRKPCPYCSAGVIVPQENKAGLVESETTDSKTVYGPYQDEYLFSVHLKCTNCKEITIAVGKKDVYTELTEGDEVIHTVFNPVFFYPAPHIIKIPRNCPATVRKSITESYALYWVDLNSCANKIRVSLEELLTKLRIRKTATSSKGKKNILTLHQRLLEYQKKNTKVANLLFSVKWIGNAGSHYSQQVTKNDILDGYEILEHSLEQLYDTKSIEITKLSSKINKKRKPLSKKKKASK